VREGETGLLAPTLRPDDLARGIARILADPRLRDHLAEGALDWSKRFRWDAVTASFAECLRAAARRAPLPPVPDPIAAPYGGTAAAADADRSEGGAAGARSGVQG
jgi:hypothetical protein